jgi:hypothetical protein
VAARRARGRPVGSTVKGGIINVVWTAGGALVVRFLRERWRWGKRRQRSEMIGGFFLSGGAFMRKLPVAGARRWKDDALVATARRCFFEAGGGELARDGGQGGRARARALVDPTPDWHLRGAGRKRAQAVYGQRTPCALTSTAWRLWNRGIAEVSCAVGGRERVIRFQAPQGSRRQGAVPFPKRIRGGGGLSRVLLDPFFMPFFTTLAQTMLEKNWTMLYLYIPSLSTFLAVS